MTAIFSNDNIVPQVLTEIEAGDGLSLSAAGRLFPGHRGGTSVNPSTVFRWREKGARSTTGGVVRLEAVRVGGRWLTSRGAVARFIAALTEAAAHTSEAHSESRVRTPAARDRAAEHAIAVLKKMGA